jgi:hypothetical protein
MQGRQRIKDILASFSDSTAADSQSRLKTVQKALNTLLTQQYLRTVSWWNVIPADEFTNKVLVEEEKKLRSERSTTSVSMTAKHQKEAAKKADIRISMMKRDERNMESLKRKLVDDGGHRKKRRVVVEDDDEEEDCVVFDYDVHLISSRLANRSRRTRRLRLITKNSFQLFATNNWLLKSKNDSAQQPH